MQFEIPAAPVLVPVWVIGVVAATVWLQRRHLVSPGRMVTVLLAATYGAAVLAVTLLPLQVATGVHGNQADWYDKINFIPVVTIDVATFVLNVVMTVPLGMLVPLLVRVDTRGRVVWIGVLFSLAIELTQAATNIGFSSGRTGDVNDIIANTAGTLLGWYAVTRLRASRPVARLLQPLSIASAEPRLDLQRTA